jgi:hypothetical protein
VDGVDFPGTDIVWYRHFARSRAAALGGVLLVVGPILSMAKSFTPSNPGAVLTAPARQPQLRRMVDQGANPHSKPFWTARLGAKQVDQ